RVSPAGTRSVDRPSGGYKSADRPQGGNKYGDRSPSGKKSGDQSVPTHDPNTRGPVVDRRLLNGGDGHGSRPTHHPRWPYRPGAPIDIDNPEVASGGPVVPPYGAGPAVPPNNGGGGNQRSSGPTPGNPTARVRGGVPPVGERRYAVDEVVVELANTG